MCTSTDARCTHSTHARRLGVEAKGANTHVSLSVDNVRIGAVRVLNGEISFCCGFQGPVLSLDMH